MYEKSFRKSQGLMEIRKKEENKLESYGIQTVVYKQLLFYISKINHSDSATTMIFSPLNISLISSYSVKILMTIGDFRDAANI